MSLLLLESHPVYITPVSLAEAVPALFLIRPGQYEESSSFVWHGRIFFFNFLYFWACHGGWCPWLWSFLPAFWGRHPTLSLSGLSVCLSICLSVHLFFFGFKFLSSFFSPLSSSLTFLFSLSSFCLSIHPFFPRDDLPAARLALNLYSLSQPPQCWDGRLDPSLLAPGLSLPLDSFPKFSWER